MPSLSPPGPHEPDEATRLASTLAGLRDPAVRLSWMADALDRLGAAGASAALNTWFERTQAGEGEAADALLTASVALCQPERGDLRRATATLAQVRGHDAIHLLLADSDHTPADAASASRVPTAPGERPLSLGERKSLARRRDRQLLDRIIRDPDSSVVRILLDNPSLTEEDVQRLCARRPVMPEVLEEVFRHPRWIVRYGVRLALALNPHTPELLAVQLLPHLTQSDRREVWRSPHATQRMRDAAGVRPRNEPLH